MKESEVRQIERIEENFLRKVLKTSKGCPIVQLYLELGHTPARLEIQKMRVLFFQYILQENDESTLKKFFNLQLEKPTRKDWASTVLSDLKELQIDASFEEIRFMSKNQLTKILKEKQGKNALKYLVDKQGTKGKDIQYSRIEMSEYLLPYTESLTIEQKRSMFEIRNKMTNIPNNFPKSKLKTKCSCGEIENMEHIYQCENYRLDQEKPKLEYKKIYSGHIKEQIEVFQEMKECMKMRENLKNTESPSDPIVIRCTSSIG